VITSTKRVLKASLITVITIVFLVFAVVNRASVHLSLFPLPYSAEMPLFLFSIFCFTLGLIVGWVAVSLKLSRSQRLLKSEHKRVLALQNEVSVMHSARQVSSPTALPKP
jgi:uncharacterized integral membrane protein